MGLLCVLREQPGIVLHAYPFGLLIPKGENAPFLPLWFNSRTVIIPLSVTSETIAAAMKVNAALYLARPVSDALPRSLVSRSRCEMWLMALLQQLGNGYIIFLQGIDPGRDKSINTCLSQAEHHIMMSLQCPLHTYTKVNLNPWHTLWLRLWETSSSFSWQVCSHPLLQPWV